MNKNFDRKKYRVIGRKVVEGFSGEKIIMTALAPILSKEENEKRALEAYIKIGYILGKHQK